MSNIQKTYDEINARIKAGEAVIVTAEEMVDIVRSKGPEQAAREVDVGATATFVPMCSCGVFFNCGQRPPSLKASKVWLNRVAA